jgi:transcription antitermination factor NusG
LSRLATWNVPSFGEEQSPYVPQPLEDYTANWYAAFTSPRHEKRIAWHCQERQIESFLPLYHTTHRWKNRCNVRLELPLFPNYLFVHIDRRERVRVLSVPGVLGIVSAGRDMSPVPEDYILSLREGLRVHRIEPHPNVDIGDRVRIVAGPMTGMEGILLRKKSELRVVLKAEMLARSIAVEVTTSDIACASAAKTECASAATAEYA